MTRRECALLIRDIILNLSASQGCWKKRGSRNVRYIDGDGWEAHLHTPFNPDRAWRSEAVYIEKVGDKPLPALRLA